VDKASNHAFEVDFGTTVTALTVRLNVGLTPDNMFAEQTYALDTAEVAAGQARFTVSNAGGNFVRADIVSLTPSGTPDITVKYSKY